MVLNFAWVCIPKVQAAHKMVKPAQNCVIHFRSQEQTCNACNVIVLKEELNSYQKENINMFKTA